MSGLDLPLVESRGAAINVSAVLCKRVMCKACALLLLLHVIERRRSGWSCFCSLVFFDANGLYLAEYL